MMHVQLGRKAPPHVIRRSRRQPRQQPRNAPRISIKPRKLLPQISLFASNSRPVNRCKQNRQRHQDHPAPRRRRKPKRDHHAPQVQRIPRMPIRSRPRQLHVLAHITRRIPRSQTPGATSSKLNPIVTHEGRANHKNTAAKQNPSGTRTLFAIFCHRVRSLNPTPHPCSTVQNNLSSLSKPAQTTKPPSPKRSVILSESGAFAAGVEGPAFAVACFRFCCCLCRCF